MFIGTKELLRMVREQKLVENLSERELTNPEGTGFDLRIGTIYRVSGEEAFLGEEIRKTPEVEEVMIWSPDKKKTFILNPGDYVLGKTIEKVNLPHNIAAIFRPRTTLFRSGIAVFTGTANPGYTGQLTFGMKNNTNVKFKLELGARVIHALFVPVAGNIVSAYRGQWQGGRVSTQGEEEKQV